MKRVATVLSVMVVAISIGCKEDEKTTEPKAGEGINIEFPGGSVKVGEGRVDVQAPGVDVKVDGKKGVGVKAPGVGVKVDTGNNVDVNAPGVDLQLESGNSKGE